MDPCEWQYLQRIEDEGRNICRLIGNCPEESCGIWVDANRGIDRRVGSPRASTNGMVPYWVYQKERYREAWSDAESCRQGSEKICVRKIGVGGKARERRVCLCL